MKKKFRVRMYFTAMQEGIIEADSREEAIDIAYDTAHNWGWDEPTPEFISADDIEVMPVDE